MFHRAPRPTHPVSVLPNPSSLFATSLTRIKAQLLHAKVSSFIHLIVKDKYCEYKGRNSISKDFKIVMSDVGAVNDKFEQKYSYLIIF